MNTSRTKLSPPQIARRWGVSPQKILAWIGSGELRAINAATRLGGRPRFLIDVADLAVFEQRRAVVATPAAVRRRRRDIGITKFF